MKMARRGPMFSPFNSVSPFTPIITKKTSSYFGHDFLRSWADIEKTIAENSGSPKSKRDDKFANGLPSEEFRGKVVQTNAIVGGVVGGVAVIAIVILVWFCLRRKDRIRAEKRKAESDGAHAGTGNDDMMEIRSPANRQLDMEQGYKRPVEADGHGIHNNAHESPAYGYGIAKGPQVVHEIGPQGKDDGKGPVYELSSP